MTHSNPLLAKYEELYGKKEKPKVIKADEFEGEVTLEQVENAFKKWSSNTSVASNLTSPSVATSNTGITKALPATSNTGITKASPIKCFDNPSGNDAFLQIAEKVKNGTAQVKTVCIEVEHYAMLSYGKKITFEVYVDN
jgi:hypothetical protein